MADPDDILKRYGPADPRWLTPEDLADRKLHPASVNQFALPPKESRHVVTNDSTRPDAYVDKNVREFMPPTMFAGSYGLGRTLGTAYGDLRMGDYSAAAHALPVNCPLRTCIHTSAVIAIFNVGNVRSKECPLREAQ